MKLKPARRKFLVFLFLVSPLFLFFIKPVFASMTLTISDTPADLWVDDEFEVSADLKDAPKTTNYYLRLALTLEGVTAYFGYTQKNDSSWHKYEETFDNFFQITTNEEGSWSGKLKGKPDKEDKDFKGTGQYTLKVDRITATGKSHDWSDNSLVININGPTPTPTLLPTTEPTSSPTTKVENMPIPTSKPTSTPAKKITPTPLKVATISGTILGEEATSAAFYPLESTPTAITTPSQTSKKNTLLAKIFLGLGMLALFGAAFSLWYTQLRNQNAKIKTQK